MRILLIEDDQLIGDGIKVGLEKQSFAVDWFRDGLMGLSALDSAQYDVVILDLTLPGLDGMEVLRQWRENGHMEPVLVLTARDALDHRVEGLNKGADDYMIKPFALQELAARLRALHRRSHSQAAALISHGQVAYCPHSFSVTSGGRPIALSPREIKLVELFLYNKGRVLTKGQIEAKLYAWGEEVASNAVEVHVHHIRRKLGRSFIRTMHRVGYTLGEPL